MESQLSDRETDIFERVVDLYIESGEPVGSRTLSKSGILQETLSSATIRNVFQDLEYAGLLHSPHTSAGRVPTGQGWRMFIDRFVSVEQIDEGAKNAIDALNQRFNVHADLSDVIKESNRIISDMAKGMAMIAVPDQPETPLEQLRFMRVGDDTVMAVLIYRGNRVENRLIHDARLAKLPSLEALSNIMSERVYGRTLGQLRAEMESLMTDLTRQMSTLEAELAEQGLQATTDKEKGLFVYKASPILDNEDVVAKLNILGDVYDALEQGQMMQDMVNATREGQGVQVFIGAQHPTFAYQGLSTVISSIKGDRDEILGAFATIVPERAPYRRIIPAVDYTSRMLGRLIKTL